METLSTALKEYVIQWARKVVAQALENFEINGQFHSNGISLILPFHNHNNSTNEGNSIKFGNIVVQRVVKIITKGIGVKWCS